MNIRVAADLQVEAVDLQVEAVDLQVAAVVETHHNLILVPLLLQQRLQ